MLSSRYRHTKNQKPHLVYKEPMFWANTKISMPKVTLIPNYLHGVLQQFLRKMSSEYSLSLIEFDSQRLDLELQYECLCLYPLISSKSLPPIDEYLFERNPYIDAQSMETAQDSLDASISVEEPKRAASETQHHKVDSIGKTKKISKTYRSENLQETSDSESQSHSKKKKNGKGKNAKNKQYPTKNFLPNFKGPHLQFLRSYLQEDLMQYEFIRYLEDKDGISLKDYECLYNMPEFQGAFEAMFKCKFLYRELMLSRSCLNAKKVHQRKLYVFEDAFRTKTFPRINY